MNSRLIEQNRTEQNRTYSDRFEYKSTESDSDSQLYNGKREQRNLQCSGSRKRCCYCNYRRIDKIDVNVAMTILARDYKGFGSGLICSNGVIEEYE